MAVLRLSGLVDARQRWRTLGYRADMQLAVASPAAGWLPTGYVDGFVWPIYPVCVRLVWVLDGELGVACR